MAHTVLSLFCFWQPVIFLLYFYPTYILFLSLCPSEVIQRDKLDSYMYSKFHGLVFYSQIVFHYVHIPYFCLFDLGSYPVVFESCSWLFTQGSILIALETPYGVLGIETKLTSFKVRYYLLYCFSDPNHSFFIQSSVFIHLGCLHPNRKCF